MRGSRKMEQHLSGSSSCCYTRSCWPLFVACVEFVSKRWGQGVGPKTAEQHPVRASPQKSADALFTKEFLFMLVLLPGSFLLPLSSILPITQEIASRSWTRVSASAPAAVTIILHLLLRTLQMKFHKNFQLTANWFLPANQTSAEMLESTRLEFCSEYADADLQIFINSPTVLMFEWSIDGFMLNLFHWAAWCLIRRHWGQPTNWSCTQHLLPPYVCLSQWIKL